MVRSMAKGVIRGMALIGPAMPVVLIGLACLAISIPVTVQSETLQERVEEIWKRAPIARFQTPDHTTRLAFRALILDLAAAPAVAPHAATAAGQAMGLELITCNDREIVLLAEQGDPRGAGIYLFKAEPPPAHPVLLEAPHSLTDIDTGTIALALFLDSNASGLFMNSMKRRCNNQDGEDDVSESNDLCDLAHNPDTLYQTATEAYFMVRPETLLIQLHGFGAYKELPGSDEDMVILSNGRRYEHPGWPMNLCIGLFSRVFGDRVLVFGRDTNLFGATTNVQGGFVNRFRRGAFLHVEMSRRLRRGLLNSEEQRAAFHGVWRRIMNGWITGGRGAR
ncbi:hypothetical protein JW905_17815 [bacterium]|nr:hypothetical protein [candidate division CSSED10-310 bacterium]